MDQQTFTQNRVTPAQADDQPVADSLLVIVETACHPPAGVTPDWSIKAGSRPDQFWTVLRHRRARTPEQGWKLHLSATICSAVAVLRRALPVLLAEDASFKLAASLELLGYLNEGGSQLSQIGKFMTVYPNDDAQAVRLAVALDQATRGLRGPVVPSDRPLRPGSLVHYRYGGFENEQLQAQNGQILPIIRGPQGEPIVDRRETTYRPPAWATDPFIAAGVATELLAPSPLIAGRYLLAATLHQSGRGTVHLAVDVEGQRRCVLKRAVRDGQMDAEGRDARDRLRNEAQVLRSFAASTGVPAVFDLVEQDGDLFLVLEHLEGTTLDVQVHQLVAQGCRPTAEQVVAWGLELTTILGGLHERGFVHRDLKSSNVIIEPDGRLSLIDFELAYELGGLHPPTGRGTRGHMSPQALDGETPSVADDVYGLGTLLYFTATAAEPSFAPHPADLLDRPISLLNPAIGPALERIIARCLDPEPADRFGSMAAVAATLDELRDSAAIPAPPFGLQLPPNTGPAREARFRELAWGLGQTLVATAQPAQDDHGLFWMSLQEGHQPMVQRDLNVGCAGAVLALAELVAELDDPVQRTALTRAATWLAASGRPARPLPGLYVGEAGVAAALLRAGQVLEDSRLLSLAAERGRWIATLPYGSPDLYNGTAGRLRLHLLLWDETTDPVHLSEARQAGELLLAAAEVVEAGELRWTIPPGYDGLSGDAYVGYAHGAAGIADALLDIFQATGEQRFLAGAIGAGRWLSRLARPVLADGSGYDWPAMEGDEPRGGTWCHGAAGVGRFFLHLAEHTAAFQTTGQEWRPAPVALAAGAGRLVARGTRYLGATQCHGLTGSIELLLDLFQASGDGAYLAEAQVLAYLLEAQSMERQGLLTWPTDDPQVASPDYLVGYAGVAVCLLRLADPARMPHQLSRQGFQRSTLPSTMPLVCNREMVA